MAAHAWAKAAATYADMPDFGPAVLPDGRAPRPGAGGLLTEADFDAHRADWVQTITQGYRGVELHEIPPNGQGLAALPALGILEHHTIAERPVDSADCLHVQIEAMSSRSPTRTAM